jgi:hypothetical protein
MASSRREWKPEEIDCASSPVDFVPVANELDSAHESWLT